MTNTNIQTPAIERALGWLGLRLLAVTIAAADQLEARHPVTRARGRLLLGMVSAIGRGIDRLPLPSQPRAPRWERPRTGVRAEVWPQPRAEG